MVRKTRIDFVNDPVQLAVRMLQEQQESAMSSLQPKKRTSALKPLMPPGMTVQKFMDILERTSYG